MKTKIPPATLCSICSTFGTSTPSSKATTEHNCQPTVSRNTTKKSKTVIRRKNKDSQRLKGSQGKLEMELTKLMGEVSLKSMGPEGANKPRYERIKGSHQSASQGSNGEIEKDEKGQSIQ